MNLGLAAATFAVVLPAELPDKTFISTVLLSSRFPALPVWLGVASGLVLQAAIAAAAGRLLALAPHRVVEGVVAGLFLLGAAWLLFVPERKEEEASEEDTEQAQVEGASTRSFLRIFATTFGVIVLAEFGDLTQVVVANLTARSKDPLSVFAGAAVAFLLISAVGVLAGRTLTRFVSLAVMRRISGVLLLGLGIWSAVEVAVA
ncbi:MAG: hypothetical protein JWM85_2655 [Acidimicrobiaceae bacterium]|nr:hypothetical protein [Acidimicrobiaceae bacterium]